MAVAAINRNVFARADGAGTRLIVDGLQHLDGPMQVAVPHGVIATRAILATLLPPRPASLSETDSAFSPSVGDARSSPGFAGFRGPSDPAGVALVFQRLEEV